MGSGQGGLLDVVLDKAFAQNRTIYFCFAERTGGGARTAVARAKLERRQRPARRRQGHLPPGGTAVVGQSFRLPHRAGRDGNLFVTLGDHFSYRDEAQNLGNHSAR